MLDVRKNAANILWENFASRIAFVHLAQIPILIPPVPCCRTIYTECSLYCAGDSPTLFLNAILK